MGLANLVRTLKLGFGGLVGGLAVACSAPTNPGEMPPLAPRPEPVQPTPARDPIDLATPDGGAPITSMPSPKLEGSHEPMQKPPADAGVKDAVALPPVPDALPPDASKRADQ